MATSAAASPVNPAPPVSPWLSTSHFAKASGVRGDYVYDVDVKALLLPNVLDVDIFMALPLAQDFGRWDVVLTTGALLGIRARVTTPNSTFI